jgi:hypothetical protein
MVETRSSRDLQQNLPKSSPLKEAKMPEYLIDDNWNHVKGSLSEQEISDVANEYQQKFFPNQAPKVVIQITDNLAFGGAAAYEGAAKRIWVPKRITSLNKIMRIALLHEMFHANLPSHDHGDLIFSCRAGRL